jgi:hypothetical protein
MCLIRISLKQFRTYLFISGSMTLSLLHTMQFCRTFSSGRRTSHCPLMSVSSAPNFGLSLSRRLRMWMQSRISSSISRGKIKPHRVFSAKQGIDLYLAISNEKFESILEHLANHDDDDDGNRSVRFFLNSNHFF